MADIKKVISDLEQQIRWIEEIECHKFPGWLNATNTMRDALALLKEQGELIERLEYDLAVAQNNLNYYINGND